MLWRKWELNFVLNVECNKFSFLVKNQENLNPNNQIQRTSQSYIHSNKRIFYVHDRWVLLKVNVLEVLYGMWNNAINFYCLL
jgi:hypothetical protein